MSGYKVKSRSLANQLKDLNTENESLRSQNSLHTHEIKLHKAELAEFKKIIDELKQENDSLQEKNQLLTEHSTHYKELKNRLDTMYNTNIHLNAQINKFKQHIKHFERTNKQLSQKLELFDQKTTENEKKNALNKKEIVNHKQRELKHKQCINQLQEELEILQSQLNSVQTQSMNPLTLNIVEDEKDFEVETKPKIRRNTLDGKVIGQSMAELFNIENDNKKNSQERSDSIRSVQSQYSIPLFRDKNSNTPVMTNAVHNEMYEELVIKQEKIEKEFEEHKKEFEKQKQQLHKQMNVIKQLKAINVKLGKRLSKETKRCYIFDFFELLKD